MGPIKPISKMFYDSFIFGSNQKSHLTQYEIERFVKYRCQNSRATFEFALIPAVPGATIHTSSDGRRYVGRVPCIYFSA